MNAAKAFFISLLLSMFVAHVAVSAPVDVFVSNAIVQGEIFEVEPVYFNSSSYAYAISVNESISFILLGEGESFSFVQDEREIQKILTVYYESKGITYEKAKAANDEIQALLGLGKKFNDSRQPNEAECNRFIGTDLMPCDDRDSCLKSCFTPVSHNQCLGVGWPFVDAIALFQNDTRNMSRAYENYSLNLKLIDENDLNDSAYLGAIASIHKMREAAVSLWYNPLFGKYQFNFCHKSYHDFDAIREAENNLTAIRQRLLPFIRLGETSEKLASEAKRREQAMKENVAKEGCVELKKNVFSTKMQLYNSISKLEAQHTDLNEQMSFVLLLAKKVEDECERNFTQANNTANYFFTQAGELSRQYEEAITLTNEVNALKAKSESLCPPSSVSQRLNEIDASLSRTDNKQLASFKNELYNLTNSLEQANACDSLQKMLSLINPILIIVAAFAAILALAAILAFLTRRK